MTPERVGAIHFGPINFSMDDVKSSVVQLLHSMLPNRGKGILSQWGMRQPQGDGIEEFLEAVFAVH